MSAEDGVTIDAQITDYSEGENESGESQINDFLQSVAS